MADHEITPDPVAEAQAEAWVEKDIADERAREAPIDDAIWKAEGEAIARAEAADANAKPAVDRPTGWLGRIRSRLGRG